MALALCDHGSRTRVARPVRDGSLAALRVSEEGTKTVRVRLQALHAEHSLTALADLRFQTRPTHENRTRLLACTAFLFF